MTIDRYKVNDALTELTQQLGAEPLPDDILNELTHHVANVLERRYTDVTVMAVIYGMLHEIRTDLLDETLDHSFEYERLIDEWLAEYPDLDSLLEFARDNDQRDFDEDHAYWGNEYSVIEDYAEAAVRKRLPLRIDSPSGWSYMSDQENGDQVDCRYCGNPLNDDLPIVNDDDGYAYHEPCLARLNAEPKEPK